MNDMSSSFSNRIIDWYLVNKRDLPWRETKDPYKIWLSEIILQQTRVDQGMNYYFKFIHNYPTILDLANATEQQVLNDWQGLGYYSRARNLHATAKHIAFDLNGLFPNNYNDILTLKGVGPYTAAAISSFAFKEAKALVDGNVYRILARFYDIPTPIDSTMGKKEFQLLADSLISISQPDIHNQSIMEFGSQQCTPVNPNCLECVLNNDCQSFHNKTVSIRPVKEKKTKVRTRFFYYAIFKEGSKICLQQRKESDIWQHLYEFPLYETEKSLSDNEILNYYSNQYSTEPIHISNEIKHVLSHQKILTKFIHFNVIPSKLDEIVLEVEELEQFPLPRLIDKYLADLNGEI